jgi:broad specificity phosphatase PhoE
MPEAHISEVRKVVKTAKPEPTNGQVRRVTGSADIPITPEGHEQAEEMAGKYSHKFDRVFCSPEQRSIETAEKFGTPIVLSGLDAWARGSFESLPAKSVSNQMKYFITHANKRPPGTSPISGKQGESYLEFLRPLMLVMRTLKEHSKPQQRVLAVTSGGDLQSVDQMASRGFPSDPTARDLKDISSCAYWTATGTLFRLTDNGLEKSNDNEEPGIYMIEHTFTAFNGPDIPKSPK